MESLKIKMTLKLRVMERLLKMMIIDVHVVDKSRLYAHADNRSLFLLFSKHTGMFAIQYFCGFLYNSLTSYVSVVG